MLKNIIYIFLAIFVLSGLAVAQPAGDPNHEGRLEFTYSDMSYMAKIDGETLDATNVLKAIKALSHGKHHLQIYKVKGMFSVELASEQKLFIPGGYIVRATLSDGKVEVYDHVPIPGLNLNTPPAQPAQPAQPVQPALESTTTTTTTTVTSSTGATDETVSFSFGVGNESISTSMSLPGMSSGMAVTEKTTVTTTTTGTTPPTPVAAPVPVVQNRPSRIVLLTRQILMLVFRVKISYL